MPPFHQVPETHDAEVLALRERYGDRSSAVLDVLRELKSVHGHLSRETLTALARAYHVPESRVAGLASFYSLLSTGDEPQRTIRLCDGIACWIQGAGELRSHCEELARGNDQISLARSSCLGLCDRAPAALAADRQIGPLSEPPASLEDLTGTARAEYLLPEERPHESRFLLRRPTGDPEPCDYSHITRMMEAGREKIFALIEQADLRGMGGAGYPTVRKWRQTAEHSPVSWPFGHLQRG